MGDSIGSPPRKPPARRSFVPGLDAAGTLAVLAGWLTVSSGQAPSQASASKPIATVGPLTVSRDEFERRAAAGRMEYERRKKSQLSPDFQVVLERQILESLIRAELLVLEAQRRKIPVTNAEAEARVKEDVYFNPSGKFDLAKFQAAKQGAPDEYRRALDRARTEIAGRKLTEQLQKQYRPEDAKVRATAERALSSAKLDVLMLRRGDFSGDYPEPRETEVLAYYRAHADEFHRPARAVLTVLQVQRPELPDAESGNASAVRAWENRLQARADSALGALRAGALLETVGPSFGRVTAEVVVVPENFPGFWRGSPALNAAVFRQAPGTWMSQPIPANPGWLLARVDAVQPARVAPLREVAKEIRTKLREDSRLHHEEREGRAIYESRKDSLQTGGYRLRYAVVDTSRMKLGEPSASDLDRYYRGHLADYTSYDARTAAIVVQPLSQVRDNVRRRWMGEQRLLRVRGTAEGLVDTWGSGKRDRGIESAAIVREVGPLPIGALVDTGAVGLAITDSLIARGFRPGVGVLPSDRGLVVYHMYEQVPSFRPTFDQIRSLLAFEIAQRKDQEDARQARALYDADPKRFAQGKLLHFTRVYVRLPELVDTPLSREEVERFYRENFDRYSVAEMVHVRQILVALEGTGPEADRVARERAEALVARARTGEDFAELARQHSDDPPTRDNGGDLGYVARGALLPVVERVVFDLEIGEVHDPVRSEVGYHVLKVVDRLPMEAEPLAQIYTNVGTDAALEKGERIARRMADSLYQTVRTPKEALAAARRLHLDVMPYTQVMGSDMPGDQREWFQRLERTPLGKLTPGTQYMKGEGAFLSWPDSITPAQEPVWEEVRGVALDTYRRTAWRRSLDDKLAEMDSLERSGWSLDSLAALWGGLDRFAEVRPGANTRGLGGADLVDSLVFGGRRAAALDVGEASGWVEMSNGLARIRLVDRKRPSASELAGRAEAERRIAFDYAMFAFFEDLKRRFPVRILDTELRDVVLPRPPEPASL